MPPDAEAPAPQERLPMVELLRQHYADVYRLALSGLGDAKAARQTTLRVFAETWLERERRPAAQIERRLYEIALKTLGRKKAALSAPAPQAEETAPIASWMVEPAIVRFNRAVDRLGTMEHRLLTLVYVLGWQPDRAAAALKVSQGAALAQVSRFHSQLCRLLEKVPPQAIPQASVLPRLPAELGAPADCYAAAVLQARWPAPTLSETDLQALAEQVEALAAGIQQRREQSRPYRRMTAVLSLAALVLLCLTGVLGSWLLSAQISGRAQPAAPTPGGALAALPTPPQVEPLSRRSSAELILNRWEQSPRLWRSLSADLQTWRYGPLSYSGLPRAYRSQAWILQPDQSIVLHGLLSGPPGEAYLGAQERVFWRSAAANASRSQPWGGALEDLLPVEPLRWMVFPASSPWALRPGDFRGVQTASLAGREAVVFDWINPQGQREARLWLDAQTGIILKAQIYIGSDFQTLSDEAVITSLSLDRREPPPALITAASLRQGQAVSDELTLAALPPTPTPATALLERPALQVEPAPPGFDPRGSRLAFQFVRDPAVANADRDLAAQPAELIADGYRLGMTRFGLPWTLRCVRSPDGRRLAFNAAGDGAAPADDAVRWFNLSQIQAIYQPLPDLSAISFAFSPDSRRLAVAGEGRNGRASGVYLVDIGIGESRLLLAAEGARSLLWSPDGEFLALIGKLADEGEAAILVLHVRTGRIAYQGEPGATDQAPPDSPTAAWGLPFPVAMGGMDDCAAPPQP